MISRKVIGLSGAEHGPAVYHRDCAKEMLAAHPELSDDGPQPFEEGEWCDYCAVPLP